MSFLWNFFGTSSTQDESITDDQSDQVPPTPIEEDWVTVLEGVQGQEPEVIDMKNIHDEICPDPLLNRESEEALLEALAQGPPQVDVDIEGDNDISTNVSLVIAESTSTSDQNLISRQILERKAKIRSEPKRRPKHPSKSGRKRQARHVQLARRAQQRYTRAHNKADQRRLKNVHH